jgi:hypothetical protein
MTRQDVELKTEMSVPQPPPRPGLAQRPKDIKSVPQNTEEGMKSLNEVPIPPRPEVTNDSAETCKYSDGTQESSRFPDHYRPTEGRE